MTEQLHKTVSVGRKTFAFGLSWFAVDFEEQPGKAAAALIKKSPLPFDLLLVRKGEAAQFALGCTAEGGKKGSISAAAMIAEMSGLDSWLYVLEIGDAVWVCAGREGYVLPDGDKVYENVDEARDAVTALAPSSFKKVYVPNSWKNDRRRGLIDAIEELEGTDIRDFLAYDIPKWAKLQPTSSVAVLLRAGVAAAILGGAAFFATTMMNDSPAPGPTEDYEAILRQLAADEEREEAELRAMLDGNKPWATTPSAADQLHRCIEGIHSTPMTMVGYNVVSVFCSGDYVQASLERTTGYSSWLKEWGQGYPELRVWADPTGSKGEVTAQLAEIEPRGPINLPTSQDFEDIQEHLFEIGQIEGAGVTVGQPVVDTLPEYPDYVPLFATGTFSITTKRPDAWLEFFSRWDGLSLDRVELTLGDNIYTMEGKLYVPNF